MKSIYKLTAVMMIVLIAALPIAGAAQLSGILSYGIKGKDGVNKVVKEKDSLNIEAVVNVKGDSEITSDQVWLGTSLKFDSCVKDISGYLCKLKFPAAGERDFKDKEPFTINLHEDGHSTPPTSFSLVDSESGYLVRDIYAPKVEISTDGKAGDKITISFTASDESYALGEYEYCAGLKTIHFSGDKVDTAFDYSMNQCQAHASFEINTTLFVEGEHAIKVQAEDYIGNKAEYNFAFEVDRTGAVFSNLHVTGKNGGEIDYIGNAVIDAVVNVTAGRDVIPGSVKADLSALNDRTDYKGLLGDCTKITEGIVCRWNIKIVPTAYGSKELIFEGTDDIGNYNDQALVKLLQKDITGPRALALKTQIVGSNNVNYITHNNNTIEVIFSESGAGLDKEQVMLDLSSLGGPKSLKAARCEQGWKCYWENLNFAVPDGKYIIAVSPDTKDRLGNKLSPAFTGEVVMDSSAPQIVNIGVNSIGGGAISYEGFATSGDSLEVTALVYEPGMLVDAYGDFSAYVSYSGFVNADECSDLGDGMWECKWITDAVDMQGYIKDTIKLSFRDFLGNIGNYGKEVIVYAIQDSYTDYWQHAVVCSPPSIDKEVTSLIDQRVYCHVQMIGGAEVMSLEMGECEGDESAAFVRKEELLNSQPGTKDPYIKLTLNAADIPYSQLSISCPLIIMSRSGNSVTSIPEIENVNIRLGFYNSPLGEYGKNMQGKIDDAIDDATGTLWKVIGALNKIMFYAERICSLITTINNVASLFNSLGFFKKSTAELLAPVNMPAAVALDNAGTQDMSITAVLNNKMKTAWLGKDGDFIDKFCKFISCRLFYDEIWGSGNKEGENKEGVFDSIGTWQRKVMEYANLVATGGPIGEKIGLGGQGVNAYTYQGREEHGGASPKLLLQGGKLSPKDSIVLSFATLCIPGIIYNLDKYRQIKCMYADCLQSSVETGVPVYVCEDQKEYETCKYVYGEVFQLLPFTGLLDYFIGLVKGVLYSPFGIVDLVIGYVCMEPVTTPFAGKVAKLCLWQEVAGMIADIWSDIANIRDDWTIRDDYCSRIKETDDDKDSDEGSGLGGLFS